MGIVRLIIILSVFFSVTAFIQKNQSATWISYPSANQTEYGVYHFRKTFNLDKAPDQMVIQVSADNRYNLFVNGARVSYGPAKGDLKTYKYDEIDIAPFLKPGKNVLAVLVYNGGKNKPLAFISAQTAFMLRAKNPEFSWVNTNPSWKVFKNPAYKVISYDEMLFRERWFYGFYACGGGDDFDGKNYPWGWELQVFDDSQWPVSESLEFDGNAPWNLVPRNIAFMDNHLVQPVRIRKVDGSAIPTGNWNGKSKLSIPANSKAYILVDFDVFTMGYPELTVDRGTNSSVTIKYAEALYETVHVKAHRDSVTGKTMFGVWDVFRTDGKARRTFRPLWKRAFRYVQLVIETKDQPLDIVSFETEYSGYPYPEMASFESNDENLNEVFTISQRTLRLCSGETYYDTPFYEQLSYGGDNRPIAAISTYNSTDDRLLREVMRLYPQSENRETGLFKSAYPSRFDFDMGSWSMGWIQSLHDYYFMRGDSGYIAPFAKNIERVLGFYERHLDEKSGLIGTVKNQNFIDWSITRGSIPRSNKQQEIKQSTLLTLYYAHTLDCAVGIFKQLGFQDSASHWGKVSSRLKQAVYDICWDEKKQLFRDYPDQPIYSQHTNIMAILCDVVPLTDQKILMNRILTYKNFDELVSSYFSFFLFKAMQNTGQDDLLLDHLDFWYTFLDRGHTTCGETGFDSHDRSDCHAWSAHPAYFLLSSVCGIKPADIGFNKVIVEPHLGKLTSLKASMPHPKGRISVDYKLINGGLVATINLPKGMSGIWEFQGKRIPLSEGVNKID
jgi:hypothetical protein